MEQDAFGRLRLAVVATTHGGGAATIAAKVRRAGVAALASTLESLTEEQADRVDELAHRLLTSGTDAVLLGEKDYPQPLACARRAPVALFFMGPRHLLNKPGLGMCGSRNASPEGLRAARACGETVATHGLNVVSGYARGVDMAAHTGALAAGGSTVLVLPEGIGRFRMRGGELTQYWHRERAIVVSQFAPDQAWHAGAAMARNAVISGLSKALVVVEAGDTGGTLAAGLHALDRGQPVLVLQLFGTPAGNQILQSRGGIAVHSRKDLQRYLDDLPSNGSLQLSLM